ncbi:hypothetical protein [Haloferula sp. BvORR071]|uniref:hypothetical protein n=1 Tax=Haloferula sp. BvORR071 TaxID=1396141 RepID=UPI000550FA32|nr:hypothetical protein [Haloferula sp. BvORR071]
MLSSCSATVFTFIAAAALLLGPDAEAASTIPILQTYALHSTEAVTGAQLDGYVTFDPALMSFTGRSYFIRSDKIADFSFEITGHPNQTLNGFYDVLLGGAVYFRSATPGEGVPVAGNSLVIYHEGNTGVYFQGTDTPAGHFIRYDPEGATNFNGTWTYQAAPEPGAAAMVMLLAPAALWKRRRRVLG